MDRPLFGLELQAVIEFESTLRMMSWDMRSSFIYLFNQSYFC